MNISLTQAELNELIYALGTALRDSRMVRREVAVPLEDKLYQALAAENVRLDKQLEEDQIRYDLEYKRAYAYKGDY